MAFVRPTLADLITRTRADFRSRLGISGALVRRAVADLLATVWAGAVHTNHGRLEWLARQLFPNQSEEEFLIPQAGMYDITKIAATFATGTTTATGVNGSVIALNDILVRDDGETYKVTTAQVIAGGTAIVPIEAVTAGSLANIDYGAGGETLDFESPAAGVDTLTTVITPGIEGGNDEETTEQLRARLLLRWREPPQGGSDQDYKAWALTIAGVTRPWPVANDSGLGTVTVYFVRDEDTPSIFPDAGEVAAVQAAIDAERPITADVTVAAPTEIAVAFSITLTPDTAATQAAVTAELTDMFARDAAPGATILLSHMRTAIGVAEGVTNYVLTTPAADEAVNSDELATLGTITW